MHCILPAARKGRLQRGASGKMRCISGVDNPLFHKETNRMLFDDAKKMLDEVLSALKA